MCTVCYYTINSYTLYVIYVIWDADFSKCVLEGKTPRVVKGHPPGHLGFCSSVIDLGAI